MIFDESLRVALANRFDIVYETTGNSPEWLQQVLVEALFRGYITIMVWPVVSPEELVRRVRDRGLVTGRFVPDDFVYSSVKQATSTFASIVHLFRHFYLVDNGPGTVHICERIFAQKHVLNLNKRQIKCNSEFAKVSLYNDNKKEWNQICHGHWTSPEPSTFDF